MGTGFVSDFTCRSWLLVIFGFAFCLVGKETCTDAGPFKIRPAFFVLFDYWNSSGHRSVTEPVHNASSRKTWCQGLSGRTATMD